MNKPLEWAESIYVSWSEASWETWTDSWIIAFMVINMETDLKFDMNTS